MSGLNLIPNPNIHGAFLTGSNSLVPICLVDGIVANRQYTVTTTPIKITLFTESFESGTLNPSKWVNSNGAEVQSTCPRKEGNYALNISWSTALTFVRSSSLDLSNLYFSFWWQTSGNLDGDYGDCRILDIINSTNGGRLGLLANSTHLVYITNGNEQVISPFPFVLSPNVGYDFLVSFQKDSLTGLTNSSTWINNVLVGSITNADTYAETDDTFILYGAGDGLRTVNTFYDSIEIYTFSPVTTSSLPIMKAGQCPRCRFPVEQVLAFNPFDSHWYFGPCPVCLFTCRYLNPDGSLSDLTEVVSKKTTPLDETLDDYDIVPHNWG